MVEYLNSIDTQLFLYLNSLHNAFFDPIMYWFSDKWIWIPMYVLMAFFIIKHYKMKGVVIILSVGLVIVLCDQTASGLIKHLVMRLRPSHEPSLAGLIHLSKAGAGGTYGFVSSHAANSFGLATFLYFVLDNRFKILKYWLFTWAVLVSYSRIYNGVHYPGDVIVAAITGALIGFVMAKIFFRVERKIIRKE